ncbi:SemiSWEET transporter [Deefgea piscis]|uniref:SemiSWEET transporter n=1 Tax=Deefgea piscis TaxID=2739061 RepID=A0A6M8SRN1_9NEIS|nr:SemiSWEET transporter [Deefgea piscis]QKJ65529.1 SemiSWEET transporter [Deefgea piscis]
MNVLSLIGMSAALCTTIAFVPQVWQVWRSRSAKDISLGMYLIFVTGVSLWLVYGFMLGDWPLILANSVTLLLAGAVLLMKLYFEHKAKK